YLNNKAMGFFHAKDVRQGYDALLEALDKDPLNPVLQYNLGIAFWLNEEIDKAFAQLDSAEKYTRDPELLFMIYFAKGVLAARQKNIDLALENYQRALDIQPESREVKENIELLWLQQGGGGGKGKDNKDQSKGKSDPNKQEDQGKDQNNPNQQPQQQQQKPQPFKSQELTKDQVRKILEELKNQEQKIRAMENEEGQKSVPKNKEW
ncbi:MAG: tetratricopeptide repeat protein, partial [Bdellovibrionales bacterium]|nr:tetratricopeptide repeat protein [Bdellovibrionales bacterium]